MRLVPAGEGQPLESEILVTGLKPDEVAVVQPRDARPVWRFARRGWLGVVRGAKAGRISAGLGRRIEGDAGARAGTFGGGNEGVKRVAAR